MLYSLSRLMGHSSVKITEIYLEDFKSRQARTQHTQLSPVGRMRVRQRGHRTNLPGGQVAAERSRDDDND